MARQSYDHLAIFSAKTVPTLMVVPTCQRLVPLIVTFLTTERSIMVLSKASFSSVTSTFSNEKSTRRYLSEVPTSKKFLVLALVAQIGVDAGS